MVKLVILNNPFYDHVNYPCTDGGGKSFKSRCFSVAVLGKNLNNRSFQTIHDRRFIMFVDTCGCCRLGLVGLLRIIQHYHY